MELRDDQKAVLAAYELLRERRWGVLTLEIRKGDLVGIRDEGSRIFRRLPTGALTEVVE